MDTLIEKVLNELLIFPLKTYNNFIPQLKFWFYYVSDSSVNLNSDKTEYLISQRTASADVGP